MGGDSDSQASSSTTSSKYSAANMTQNQTWTYSSSKPYCTVQPTSKTLTISGLSAGQKIYAVHTNPESSQLSSNYQRVAYVSSSGNFAETDGESIGTKIESPLPSDGLTGYDRPFNPYPEIEVSKQCVTNFASTSNGTTSYSAGDTETFYYPLDDPSVTKNFTLLYTDDNYNVWVDSTDSYYKNNTSTFTTAAKKLGSFFWESYEIVSNIYGNVTDSIYDYSTDSSGTPVFSNPQAMSLVSKTGSKINLMFAYMSGDGVLGFVSPADFYANYTYGNKGIFLYLDSKSLLDDYGGMQLTAIHEFSHAITCSVKVMTNHGDSNLWPYWYGEMLAMICEDMMSSYVGISDSATEESSGSATLADSPKARLARASYLGNYQGLTGKTSDTYACAFLFGAWLTRKFGGISFVKELATNEAVGWDSILSAVNNHSSTAYTTDTLLQAYAGDLLSEDNSVLNTVPSTSSSLTYSSGSTTYSYPFTAINLWADSDDSSAYFYGWGELSGSVSWTASGSPVITNETFSPSLLPSGNIFYSKKDSISTCFNGPACLNGGTYYGSYIGPYSYQLNKVTDVTSSYDITLEFESIGGNSFGDTLTIWVY